MRTVIAFGVAVVAVAPVLATQNGVPEVDDARGDTNRAIEEALEKTLVARWRLERSGGPDSPLRSALRATEEAMVTMDDNRRGADRGPVRRAYLYSVAVHAYAVAVAAYAHPGDVGIEEAAMEAELAADALVRAVTAEYYASVAESMWGEATQRLLQRLGDQEGQNR